ncbi:glycosyltransferase family 4 protein [Lentibacillus saliphilus]|uniref:glycosyltransferase family 4 protein n=1 Tax=Lentibacillus saliphilus TaxID=2737028 RepID=UPI001C30947D|nr:glycosyltransferase family 4 protein [Lentibacillus saliphilus]
MKAKVLQICAIDFTVDKLLKPLIEESANNGYETHVACTDTGLFNKLSPDVSNLHNIHIKRSISPISNIKSIVALYKLMKREQFDIVHVHTPIAALLGRVAAKLARAKHVVYTAHGFYFHEDMSEKQYKFYYMIEKYAAKFLTDWLLLQSEEDYRLAIEDRFLKKDRIIHLSNGVDVLNKFNPDLIIEKECNQLKGQLGIKESNVVFTFIGRMVEEKGVLELLRSFKLLTKEHPNAKLLMIGDLPESERDTSSIHEIKALMNQDNVHFLGYRDDIKNLLSISDVFVLPSYREGLPRSIIEAMAMENAIIATNIRGCREQVISGVNGYLVNRRSIEELKSAMEQMLRNQVEIKEMAKESRVFALEKFNEEKVLTKQMKLFDQLTNRYTQVGDKCEKDF